MVVLGQLFVSVPAVVFALEPRVFCKLAVALVRVMS